jgi:hypothetical protein
MGEGPGAIGAIGDPEMDFIALHRKPAGGVDA